jgi:membrane-bound acyltransferase YfiQ involved in biofilm formation
MPGLQPLSAMVCRNSICLSDGFPFFALHSTARNVLGLLWFFCRRANQENALTRFIAANAFGVYMLHPPVLIGFSLLFRFWEAAASPRSAGKPTG